MTLRPSCRVYRGSDVRRAIDRVQGAAPSSITTKRTGDFDRGRDVLSLHSMKPTRTNVQSMATPVAAWSYNKMFLHVS
jgi:hypothetical protein